MHSPYSFHPRDRARERARRAIHQRVQSDADTPPCEEEPWTTTPVVPVLHAIIDNHRSFFSLCTVHKHARQWSRPIPTDLLWRDDNDAAVVRGQDKLTSWYGPAHVADMQRYLTEHSTISLMDYALLFQRHHIVGALVLGGLDPTAGRNGADWDQELHQTGRTVLQTFFCHTVPLTLSSYTLKRCFELRWAYWKQYHARDQDRTCHVCHRPNVPSCVCLCWDCASAATTATTADAGDAVPPPPPHIVCEPCYWNTTLQRLEEPNHPDDDVVACPLCVPPVTTRHETGVVVPSAAVRRARYETSRDKFYHRLPPDRHALRSRGRKQPPKVRRGGVTTNWTTAVAPLLGHCQATRRDRWFHFVTHGRVHPVRACLHAGMDVNVRNPYGQTALATAAWRGLAHIVQVLLDTGGADPNLCDNAGTSPLDAAAGWTSLVAVLQAYGGQPGRRRPALPETPRPHAYGPTTDLIPRDSVESSHPGAGLSYTIDHVMDEPSIRALVELYPTLPVASGRTPGGPCAERRYWCDVHGSVRAVVHAALTHALASSVVVVSPWMRFLSSTQPGTVLAPHVDLSRDVTINTDTTTTTVTTTHTFVLYLTECRRGGATALLRDVSVGPTLAVVTPRPGRLLVFPHACPHEGQAVVEPKLLLRGEVYVATDDDDTSWGRP